ncbi:retinoblastoma family protein [Drosophila nasuta]|uniref:retinoblastoma family protein n=1 Tax=Drosophila nasuta TaxID=42062 RepID=UPI00295EA09B|nr:retinoblastoma family protein [Drosophila nasuta]
METEEKGVILQRFAANCRKLQIDSDIWENATTMFHKLNADGALSSDADDWLCCAVYSELQQAKMKDMRQEQDSKDNDVESHAEAEAEKAPRSQSWNMSLTKVLSCFGMNIGKFFKRMEHWNCMAKNSSVFQQEIIELNRRLGITLLLLQHYKRIFRQLYVQPEGPESRAHYQMIYEFGWLLFLVVRNELPPFATSNLIHGCQVLICALELVYVNALEVRNSDIINSDFRGLPAKWRNGYFDNDMLNKFSAIDAICQLLPELPQKGARIMKNAFFHKAMMSLFMDQRLLGNDRYMRELIKDGLLEINLCSLNRSYEQHVNDISEMDERVLLKHKETTKLNNGEDKCNGGNDISNLSQLLSLELPKALPSCVSNFLKQDEIKLLHKTLRDMCHKLERAAQLTKQKAECRFQLASGLYYMLLEQIAEAELRRNPTFQIVTMLITARSCFNASLIACCLQLVLHLFDDGDDTALQFPWLLDGFAIDAFDFQKIIELVVRHASDLLPRDLIKHLREVEDECLSSLIWRKKSPLWRLKGELPSYRSVQLSASNGQENAAIAPSAVVICLRKFYMLAQQRLNYLCKGLSLLGSYSTIWHLVEHSIVAHGVVLLQERHLDQLLICAIYLCKRQSQQPISFSTILQQYRRQPHARSVFYRSVHLGDGDDPIDIIGFYNRVYVGLMAEYARKLHCEQPLEERALQNLSNNTVLRLRSNGNNTNVYVSREALPRICMSEDCGANNDNEKNLHINVNLNLKRAPSNLDLNTSKPFPPSRKRPNILRRLPRSSASSGNRTDTESEGEC